MDILELIRTIGGFVAGGGLTLFCFKAFKKKMTAESYSAEAEATNKSVEAKKNDWHLEQERIESLHAALLRNNETIETNVATIDSLVKRLSMLNATVDKHIDRNRELSDRVYQAEREKDELSKQLLKAIEGREYYKRVGVCYKEWQCRRSDCLDPRGREPDNPKLKGRRFIHPETSIIVEENITEKKS